MVKVYEDDVEESPLQISPEQIFNIELNNYLSLPKLDAEEEILPWWKSYSNKYPFTYVTTSTKVLKCMCD